MQSQADPWENPLPRIQEQDGEPQNNHTVEQKSNWKRNTFRCFPVCFSVHVMSWWVNTHCHRAFISVSPTQCGVTAQYILLHTVASIISHQLINKSAALHILNWSQRELSQQLLLVSSILPVFQNKFKCEDKDLEDKVLNKSLEKLEDEFMLYDSPKWLNFTNSTERM